LRVPAGSNERGRRFPSKRGFTVIEVMCAVAVMALAIGTSITTLQVGYRAIDTARNTTIASQVLQSMIEDIRLLTWAQVSNTTLMPDLSGQALAAFDLDTTNHYQSKSITDFSSNAAAMLSRFRFSRTISDVAGRTDVSGASTMKVIVLTATWTGIDGLRHTVEYTSYYAKDGLYAYYST
jgi:prepilin-type N-terminal cleavage/methylation domain-containing protein